MSDTEKISPYLDTLTKIHDLVDTTYQTAAELQTAKLQFWQELQKRVLTSQDKITILVKVLAHGFVMTDGTVDQSDRALVLDQLNNYATDSSFEVKFHLFFTLAETKALGVLERRKAVNNLYLLGKDAVNKMMVGIYSLEFLDYTLQDEESLSWLNPQIDKMYQEFSLGKKEFPQLRSSLRQFLLQPENQFNNRAWQAALTIHIAAEQIHQDELKQLVILINQTKSALVVAITQSKNIEDPERRKKFIQLQNLLEREEEKIKPRLSLPLTPISQPLEKNDDIATAISEVAAPRNKSSFGSFE